MRVLQQCLPVVLAAPLLACAGCHRQTVVEPVDDPRSFAGVVMKDVTFHSAALERDMNYRAYMPAVVPEGGRLPVVYLLHGSAGSYRTWSHYSAVGEYASRGLILVMPDGHNSYYTNAALEPRERYEDYVIHDLIADVESRLPAAPGRENRTIVGFSMGGYGAVKFALTRPDLFAFAGALSPAVDVPGRAFSWRRWSQSMRFRRIFGPSGSTARAQNDPFLLVKSADPGKTPYLYITAGKQEMMYDSIRSFAGILKQGGYAYEFHTGPGSHDWSEWNAQIPDCFESLLAHLNKPQPENVKHAAGL